MKYHQTINSMATPFISSSHAKTVRGSWNHVFHRDRTTKRSWDINITKRNAKNYIKDKTSDMKEAIAEKYDEIKTKTIPEKIDDFEDKVEDVKEEIKK